ncbi:MAG: ATP-binding protein [Eubacteriales bacterium]|nr:ATP-binding protein [Eubacteriales bacterium]
MRELALNILDIVENSVKANATLIEIDVSAKDNLLTVSVKDNGKGMSEEFLSKVTDPYTTTRTTRKVGLGLPLLKMEAEMCGGRFSISSKLGVGTIVATDFQIDHIDRPPLGDLGETMSTLLSGEDNVDYVLTYSVNDVGFTLDTRELKAELDGVPISEPEVLLFVKNYIRENISQIGGLL